MIHEFSCIAEVRTLRHGVSQAFGVDVSVELFGQAEGHPLRLRELEWLEEPTEERDEGLLGLAEELGAERNRHVASWWQSLV